MEACIREYTKPELFPSFAPEKILKKSGRKWNSSGFPVDFLRDRRIVRHDEYSETSFSCFGDRASADDIDTGAESGLSAFWRGRRSGRRLSHTWDLHRLNMLMRISEDRNCRTFQSYPIRRNYLELADFFREGKRSSEERAGITEWIKAGKNPVAEWRKKFPAGGKE